MTTPSRILIVDDNQAIHDDFQKILMPPNELSSGLDDAARDLFGPDSASPANPTYSLASAFQGKQALEMVAAAVEQDQPYEVAFLDIRMPPGWDGVKTAVHLWEIDPFLQIVLCTANSEYSWEDIQQRLGDPDRYLILKKPFDNIEVLQLAASLVKKWSFMKASADAAKRIDADILHLVNCMRALQEAASRFDVLLADRDLLECATAECAKTELTSLRAAAQKILANALVDAVSIGQAVQRISDRWDAVREPSSSHETSA